MPPMSDPAFWYVLLKTTHVGCVIASGLLFGVRGVLLLCGHAQVMQRPWRLLSYAIDTVLLSAALGLWALLSLNPLTQAWLATKLILLPIYIVLGSLALKRGRTAAVRRGSLLAAVCVYLLMALSALSHRPLGLPA